MKVIGIDLSGPSNHKDTYLTVFEAKDNELKFIKYLSHLSDEAILEEVFAQSKTDEVVIGIDAPLSYEDGGGDRKSDKSLRKFIVELGMKSSSIMPPTLNRMVYLTLRGIKLTREIMGATSVHPISIVEVHPGAIIGSRLSPAEIEHVLTYKQDLAVRRILLNWFKQQQVFGVPEILAAESHSIDACAAAIGAWNWKEGKSKWVYPAKFPLHPFEFCC